MRSWVIAWLFIFGAGDGFCQPPFEILQVSPDLIADLPIPESESGVGTALCQTSDGNLLALLDQPPRIVSWEVDWNYRGSLGEMPDRLRAPSDITAANRMEILISDPWIPALFRLDRRQNQLPPIQLDFDNTRIEPIAVCVIDRGTIFILNQADNDVWRIDPGGRIVSMNWASARGGELDSPTAMTRVTNLDRLAILDGEFVRFYDVYNGYMYSLAHQVTSSAGISASESEIWVAGNTLSCIDALQRTVIGVIDRNRLSKWNLSPAADVQVIDRNHIAVLAQSPARVAVLKILR